mmetsp:Transcript_30493/g.63658  ORF Transcript_30493/g.63658 Transcript_30493/m.63658 type:complete len:281 (-) Transcript_30493:327-1169(-)
MNTIREVQKINQEELARGIAGTKASWHAQYAQSAWIYVGNLDHGLSEGDVICVLSQYGEIEDFSLVREEETGKSRGFAFCKYENAKSCILAVDNFCGIELCGRSLRVDHVENYRLPKHLLEKEEQEGAVLTQPGLAYHGKQMANDFSLQSGQDLFAPPQSESEPNNNPPLDEEKSSQQQQQAKLQRKMERQRIREERAQRKLEKEQRKLRQQDGQKRKRSKRYESESDRTKKHGKKSHKQSRHKKKDGRKSKRRRSDSLEEEGRKNPPPRQRYDSSNDDE